MITYRKLCRTRGAFRTLSGLSLPEFDALCREWVHADALRRSPATHTRAGHQPRRRAPGAGRPYGMDAPTRLLMALLWLKVYPTWTVLGSLFAVEESMARRSTRDVLSVLETRSHFPLERRTGRHRGRPLEQVVREFPAVAVLIDASEQRIRRPRDWDEQKPFDSGKKKAHPLKNQIAVSASGRIGAVSASVPGRVHDLPLLCGSGLLEKLEPGEGIGLDKGYTGIEEYHPEPCGYVPIKKPRGGELSPADRQYNHALASVRIAVEHVFARIRRWGARAQVWRHRRNSHSGVFRVAAWLADRQIAALEMAQTA